MAKLKITDSSGREREVEIGSKPMVFGRGEDSDLVLGSRSISRHHLKIWEDRGKVMVEDLTNGQGTRLDDQEAFGTFEWPPDAELKVGAFTFNLLTGALPREEAGGGSKRIGPVPILEGIKGPIRGLEIELQEGVNGIGRDPNSYVTIDDPSISRQHAEITIDGDRFSLTDLHSSNGTFVDGKRIESASLRSGVHVRFGDMEFRFLCGTVVSSGMPRARKLLWVTGALVGSLLVAGIYFKYAGGRDGDISAQDAGPIEPLAPPDVLAEQHLRVAEGYMAELNWDDAEKEVDQALDLHPISRDAKEAKRKIKQERLQKSAFENALSLYELNKKQEALEAFKAIPKESAYFPKAKVKISELERSLTEYHLKEGTAYFKANQFKLAHKHFADYLQVKHCARDVYEKWVKKTETILRRNGTAFTPVEYQCNDPSQEQQALATNTPEDRLKIVFPDQKIGEALLLYFKGKVDAALVAVRRIARSSKDPKLTEKANELERFLMLAGGKYNEGTALLLRGDLKASREKFRMALENDARIIPQELRSYYRDDIGRQLAAKLNKVALEEFTRQQWEKAFASWSDCLQFKPDDTTCMGGLQELEKVAEEALTSAGQLEERRDERAFERWKLVMKITRPESLPYKTAQLKLSEYGQK